MAIQRADEVLNGHVAEYLAKKVPEGLSCFYSVAPVTYLYTGECEDHGEQITSQVVWQVHVFIETPDRGENDPPPYRMNAVVPYTYLDDGDTDCLTSVLDQMWSDYTFAGLMREVDPALGGIPEPPEE